MGCRLTDARAWVNTVGNAGVGAASAEAYPAQISEEEFALLQPRNRDLDSLIKILQSKQKSHVE